MKSPYYSCLAFSAGLILILGTIDQAHAQSQAPASARRIYGAPKVGPVNTTPENKTETSKTDSKKATDTTNATAKKEEAPAPAPIPFGASYTMNYTGPEFGKSFQNTYGIDGAETTANIEHVFSVSYKGFKPFSFGLQIAGVQADLDPKYAEEFAWGDLRLVMVWPNMIDSDWTSLTSILRPQFPTSDASQASHLFVRIDWINSFSFKIPSEVFSAGLTVMLSPRFFMYNQSTTNDFVFLFAPNAGYKISDVFSLGTELSLITSHQYGSVLFDYEQFAEDTWGFSLGIDPIKNIHIEPGFNLYLDNPSLALGILSLQIKLSI
jgi:hypothetical protein